MRSPEVNPAVLLPSHGGELNPLLNEIAPGDVPD